MKLLFCLIFIICLGIIVFLCGRFFPRRWIFEDRFPYKSFSFEKRGNIYKAIKIQKWKKRWPDGSKIFHKFFGKFYPVKKMEEKDMKKIPILIKESCVAESTHFIVIILGVYCLKIWSGLGGVLVWIIWTLWNIPPILIQRYNRPRLKHALQKCEKK